MFYMKKLNQVLHLLFELHGQRLSFVLYYTTGHKEWQ